MFFLKLSCFFHDPEDVGNLISYSSAFSKTSLNIWKFTVQVLLKPGVENFEHYFTSVLLLLLLSCFSHVWLCATPWMAAHQAPLSLGFSQQEHWSGLPFPSPMHESEIWKWSRSVVSDSVTPWTAAHQAPPSMGVSRQEYWSGLPLPSKAY